MSVVRLRAGLRDFFPLKSTEGQLVVPTSGPPATKADTPPPSPRNDAGDGLVRMPLICSVYGGFSIVEGRLEKDVLHWLRNLRPADGERGNMTMPASLGHHRIIFAESPGCGVCGAKTSTRRALQGFWVCNQTKCGGGLFHCVGEKHGQARCACGDLRSNTFTYRDSFEVRGTHNLTSGRGSQDARDALRGPELPALPAPHR